MRSIHLRHQPRHFKNSTYEKIIVDKAESFLVDKHDEEVAQIFIDMLSDRHDISLGSEEPEIEVSAMGATGAGE